MKGCSYDNAVAEATFKIIKTEFVKGQHFDRLKELTRELHDYVHWFNHIQIDGTLGYVSPIDYKLEHQKKLSSLVLTYQFQLNLCSVAIFLFHLRLEELFSYLFN